MTVNSGIDRLVRLFTIGKIFEGGWGPNHVIQILPQLRENCFNDRRYILKLAKSVRHIEITHREPCALGEKLRGKFVTPLFTLYPDVVPQALKHATFEMVVPKSWDARGPRAMCIQLARTGDETYSRRMNIAQPLLEHGIGSILLQNPYYGERRPPDYKAGARLRYVADVFIMGACLVLECTTLLNWCEQQNLGPLGLTGISLGGHMATLAATFWEKPIVLVPCLSWTTASTVFTKGVMANAIDWDRLTEQYYGENNRLKLFTKRNGLESNVIPSTSSSSSPRVIRKFLKRKRDENVEGFMRFLMDEFTYIGNYPPLTDPSLCTVVCATDDAYVPREGTDHFSHVWRGVNVHYIKTGHVLGIVAYQRTFFEKVLDAFKRAEHRLSTD